MCFNGIADGTALEKDIVFQNYFRAVQKVHVLVIELAHLPFSTDYEENIEIANTKLKILTAFHQLEQVSTTWSVRVRRVKFFQLETKAIFDTFSD